MTDTYKVLGQAKPAATTLTDLYVVPAATQTSTSSIVVCNQSATATTFRVSVAIAGAADALTQYQFYDAPLDPNETKSIQLGITLGATDKVRVYSAAGTVSFSAFGVEIT